MEEKNHFHLGSWSRGSFVALTFPESLITEVNTLSISISQGGELQRIKMKYSAYLSQHSFTFLRYVTREGYRTREHLH